MDTDCDIYENLPNEDVNTCLEIEKLRQENERFKDHICSLEADVDKLCANILEMKEKYATLSRNISELYKTAKAEIERKDRLIASLRSQVDEFTLQKKSHIPLKRERSPASRRTSSDSVTKKYKHDDYRRTPDRRRSRSRSRDGSKRPYSEKSKNRDDKHKSLKSSKSSIAERKTSSSTEPSSRNNEMKSKSHKSLDEKGKKLVQVPKQKSVEPKSAIPVKPEAKGMVKNALKESKLVDIHYAFVDKKCKEVFIDLTKEKSRICAKSEINIHNNMNVNKTELEKPIAKIESKIVDEKKKGSIKRESKVKMSKPKIEEVTTKLKKRLSDNAKLVVDNTEEAQGGKSIDGITKVDAETKIEHLKESQLKLVEQKIGAKTEDAIKNLGVSAVTPPDKMVKDIMKPKNIKETLEKEDRRQNNEMVIDDTKGNNVINTKEKANESKIIDEQKIRTETVDDICKNVEVKADSTPPAAVKESSDVKVKATPVKKDTKIKKDNKNEDHVLESGRVLRSATRRNSGREKHEKATAVSLFDIESTNTMSLTHEGEIPVLHISDNEKSPNNCARSLFELNLNTSGTITSSPVRKKSVDLQLLKDDLDISFEQSASENKIVEHLSDSNVSLNVSSKHDSAARNGQEKLLNVSSGKKRKRYIVSLVDSQ